MKELYTSFQKSKWFPLVAGIVCVVFGVICVLNPKGEMAGLALYLGFAFLLFGLFHLVAGFLVKDNKSLRLLHFVIGAVVVLLAILTFVNLEMIGKYLPSFFGFFMIINALSNLLRSVVLLKNGEKSWWVNALLAVVILVLGFIFLLNPGYVGQAFGIFSGVALLASGLSQIAAFVQLRK